jgi:hypothetical protein
MFVFFVRLVLRSAFHRLLMLGCSAVIDNFIYTFSAPDRGCGTSRFIEQRFVEAESEGYLQSGKLRLHVQLEVSSARSFLLISHWTSG